MSNAEMYLLFMIGLFAGVLVERLFKKPIIKIVHHVSAGGEVELLSRLDFITSKLDDIMTKEERLQLAIQNLNEGTNEIAADLQALKEQIAAGTVSEDSLKQLEDNIEVLKQLGQQQ